MQHDKGRKPTAFPCLTVWVLPKGYGDDMGRNGYFAQIITRKIKVWCEENDATQQDFCRKVGLHPNMITRYKKGKAYPTDEVLEAMCYVLGCDANEFIPVVKKEKTLSDQRN